MNPILKLRKDMGMNQTQFAMWLGIRSSRTIGHVEHGGIANPRKLFAALKAKGHDLEDAYHAWRNKEIEQVQRGFWL